MALIVVPEYGCAASFRVQACAFDAANAALAARRTTAATCLIGPSCVAGMKRFFMPVSLVFIERVRLAGSVLSCVVSLVISVLQLYILARTGCQEEIRRCVRCCIAAAAQGDNV